MSFITEISSSSWTEDWRDAARERSVPVRIFIPAPDSGGQKSAALKKYPVVLLSHGLGGSREGFGYLGDALAEHGYIVIAMQHTGSDINLRFTRKSGETVIQAMSKAANADEANQRYEDVKFVIAELEKRNKTQSKEQNKKHSLFGKIDFDKIGIGGHSFGSQTALAAAGRLPYKHIEKIKAAVVMSPNTVKDVNPALIHENIAIPILHLTGTDDRSPLDKAFDPKNRRIPFDNINGTDQYLVIFDGGTHLLFSGHRRPFGTTAMEKKCQPVITEIIVLFFDAYLKEDGSAEQSSKQKIQSDELNKLMKALGTAEKKLPHQHPQSSTANGL